MKKFLFLILAFSIIVIGCKKTSSTTSPTPTQPVTPSPPTPVDTSFINPTGLIQSTEQGLQNIPFVETLDTSLIPFFGRMADLPPSAYEDVPDPPDTVGQGTNGSCVGWAVGYGMLGYLYKHIEGHSDYNGSDKRFSPSYIWNQLNRGINQGIRIDSALLLIKNQGCCKQTDMELNLAPSIQPSTIARTNAASYKITEFVRFSVKDINRMKFYLSKGYPILVGINVDKTFCNVKAHPFEEQPSGRLVWKKYTDKDKGLSGHAVLICGYDNSTNAFKVLNSWGYKWGNEGYFWIDYNFFDAVVATTDGSRPEIYIGYTKRPIISTKDLAGISATSAQSGGIMLLPDWGVPVTSRGVCWSATPNPTTANSKTSDGTGTGSFTSNITGLVPNTTYYVKAYATNSVGTSYGTEKTFTTASIQITVPTLSTTDATTIAQTSATSGGNITNDGGATITVRGVCWNTAANPTTANSKTSDGTGTGSFTSSITGLAANTTYYLRAYATNSAGTAYGNEVSFLTSFTPAYTIGQVYGGGIIFYIDGTLQHGLITSSLDLTDAGGVNTSIDWSNGSSIVTSANGTAIGTGLANTNTIVSSQGSGDYAAKICRNYSGGGFTDWYLPSKDELNQLYINKNTVGTFNGFTTYSYWSSTEASASQAWAQSFLGGTQNTVNKSGFGVPRVRAIRTF